MNPSPLHSSIAKIGSLFALAVCIGTGLAHADTITTVDGKTYENVSPTVEPDGIKVITDDGIVKIPFAKLPADLQTKYGFNPAQAAAFQAQLRSAAAARGQEAMSFAQQQAAKLAVAPEPAATPAKLAPAPAAPATVREAGSRLTPNPAAASYGQKYTITGSVFQKSTEGILVRCTNTQKSSGHKKPAGELVLITGHPDQQTLVDHALVKCTATDLGVYSYGDVIGSLRTVQALQFWSK